MNSRSPYLAYLRTAAITVATLVTGIVLSLLYFDSKNGLAPIPLWGSISFDEKAAFLRKLGPKHPEVLSIGSSLTLNNLSSAEVKANLPPGWGYLNLSAWALVASNFHNLIDSVRDQYKPKVVITVCAGEWSGIDYPIDAEEYREFIRGDNFWKFFLRHFDVVYYWNRQKYISKARADRSHYDSLRFDESGGIPYEFSYPNVDPVRWDAKLALYPFKKNEYDALEEIAKNLADSGITFLYVTPPMREVALTPAVRADREIHLAKVAEILQRHHGIHIDLREVKIADSGYVDSTHMNVEGATQFTRALMARAKPLLLRVSR